MGIVARKRNPAVDNRCSLAIVLILTAHAHSRATQFTVNTSTLLLPPLVQPRSPEFPLGVSTLTFTGPGPEITSVLRRIFSCWLLATVAPSALPLMTTSDDETKWLPFTMSKKPSCT